MFYNMPTKNEAPIGALFFTCLKRLSISTDLKESISEAVVKEYGQPHSPYSLFWKHV